MNHLRTKQNPIPSNRQRQVNGNNAISQLDRMGKEMKLTDNPRFRKLLKGIMLKKDHFSAQKIIKKLESTYLDHLIKPNNFILGSDDITGEIMLGHTEDGKAVGLDRAQLNRHTLISGSSGSGKSYLTKTMILQAKQLGIYVISYDPKGDLEHTVKEGISSLHYFQKRINPQCPSTTKGNLEEHSNYLGNIYGDLFEVKERGRAIIRISLYELYTQFDVYSRWHTWDWNTMIMPTTRDWLDLLKSPHFQKNKIKGQGRESLISIIEKLEGLLIELGPVLDCQRGFDVGRMFTEKWCINYVVTGLSTISQKFLMLCDLLHNAYYFRVHGPRNQLNLLMVFDEAKRYFGREHE